MKTSSRVSWMLVMITLLLGTRFASAQSAHEPHKAPEATTNVAAIEAKIDAAHGATEPPEPRPHLSRDAGWVFPLALVILLVFFVGAAVVGPIVGLELPEEAPAPHGHDEHGDHAVSHGHGGH